MAQKPAKIRRTEAVAPTADDETEDDSKLFVQLKDEIAVTSSIQGEHEFSYNVPKNEIEIRMGDAKTFINARIAINKIYERLGMKRRIDNPALTAQLAKFEQKSKQADVLREEPSEHIEEVPPSTREWVHREMDNLLYYGSNKFVTIKNNGETSNYAVKLYKNAGSFTVTFTSLDTEKQTGTLSIPYKQIVEAVAELVGTDGEPSYAAMLTSRGRRVSRGDFVLIAGSPNGKSSPGVAFDVQVPDDEFVNGAELFVTVGTLRLLL